MRKLGVAAIAFGFASLSQAVVFTYTAALNGFQEVPMTGSPGISNVVLQLDDVAQTLSGTGTVQFLSGPVIDFHLHHANFGVNGPVVVPIGASGVSGNVVSFTVPVTNFAVVKGWMDNFETYLNMHTSQNPGGEIRGQVTPVPEPATMAVLGLGAAAMLRRRKR